ncbi:hypothetical protein ARSEF4850_007027 [Beauveria asiatica]
MANDNDTHNPPNDGTQRTNQTNATQQITKNGSASKQLSAPAEEKPKSSPRGSKQDKLSHLPVEMILAIGASIKEVRDLKNFASSNQCMYLILGPSIIRRYPTQALMHYAARNNIEGMRNALKAKADIDTLYESTGNERKKLLGRHDSSRIEKHTPLHIAAIHGSINAAEYLLEQGASINAETSDKTTALWFAALGGFKEMVRLLHKKGGDVDREHDSHGTPLHYFIQGGNERIVRCLLELGANVHTQDIFQGDTPLGSAADVGNTNICRLLLQSGSDINYRNRMGRTALHIATTKRHVAVARCLLENGAAVHETDDDGNTSLMLAAKCGSSDIFRLLHKNGSSDINFTDSNGNTALHIAATDVRLELTKYLLKNGADVHITNADGDIALGLAAKNAERLPDQSVDCSKMNADGVREIRGRAARATEIFQLLCENGSDINHKNNGGYTPQQLGERAQRSYNEYLVASGYGKTSKGCGVM